MDYESTTCVWLKKVDFSFSRKPRD